MNTRRGGIRVGRDKVRGRHKGNFLALLATLGCFSPEDSTLILPSEEKTPCPECSAASCSTPLCIGNYLGATVLNSSDSPPEPTDFPETQPLSYRIEAVEPVNGSLRSPLTTTLGIELEELATPTTALFYGREVEDNIGDPFTVIVLPDTQHYVDTPKNAQTFVKQVEWILTERTVRNIKLVDHLGDIVQHPNNPEEWQRAAPALQLLNQDEIAVGIAPGNHDLLSSTNASSAGSLLRDELYDDYLSTVASNPVGNYEFRPWYGGYMGDRNDRVIADDLTYENRQWKNNYVLFSAGGMLFLNVAIEHQFPGNTEQWLDHVLTAFPERRVILSTHEFLGTDGEFFRERYRKIWNRILMKHCNVFLVLSAHVFGESRRQEIREANNPACPNDPVHFLTSNYQQRKAGGDGWLRIMSFRPADDRIDVQTYSPTLNGGEYETDANSEFSIPYSMRSEPKLWNLLDGHGGVQGGRVSSVWNDLTQNTTYQWYVEFTDSQGTLKNSDTYQFTTEPERQPTAPSALESTSFDSERIDLQWVDNSASENGYVILLGDPGNLSEVARIASDRTSYSVIGLKPDTQYCFEVFASSAVGERSTGTFSCTQTPPSTD